MPKKKPAQFQIEEIPDLCPTCGQTIDKRSAASIDHHARPKHLPWTGKTARPSWL
jgi:hypothetical protein